MRPEAPKIDALIQIATTNALQMLRDVHSFSCPHYGEGLDYDATADRIVLLLRRRYVPVSCPPCRRNVKTTLDALIQYALDVERPP